jgi:Niemann-Pick C1 protein
LFHQQDKFADTFGHFMRTEQVIFKAKGFEKEGQTFNIIQKKYLQEVLYFQLMVNATRIKVDVPTLKEKGFEVTEEIFEAEGREFGMMDLCWSAFPNRKCTYQSPGGYFQNNLETLNKYTDADIPGILLCTQSIDAFGNTLPCEDETGIPVQKSAVFGQLEEIYDDANSDGTDVKSKSAPPCENCDNKTRRLFMTKTQKADAKKTGADDNSCKSFTYRAKSFLFSVLLNYQDQTDFISEQWELKAIVDTVKLWRSNSNTNFLRDALPEQAHLIEADQPLRLEMSYLTERSITDELQSETAANAWIVIVSYFLMFIYVGFALGKFPHKYETTFALGLAGIILVITSVGCGYACVSYFNIKASLISVEVVPFLILAIGVDNMFIISRTTTTLRNRKGKPYRDLNHRIAMAIRDVGPSITVATIVESLTFGIGTLTSIPALRVFC